MKNQIVRLDKKMFSLQKDNIYKCTMDLVKQDNNLSEKIINNMEKFLNDESAIIYVSIVHDNIIGFVWGYFIQKHLIHINYFVVLHEYRGKKNGYDLLSAMTNMNKSCNFELLVNIDNKKAIGFYEKFGFKQIKIINQKIKMKFGGEDS